MYYIKESEWTLMEKNHSDYCGRSIRDNRVRTIFEGTVPGNLGKGGTTLLFEYKHFLVVPDQEFAVREEPMERIGTCFRCGFPLFPSQIPGYKFQCFFCDEDFFEFEQK